MEKAATRALMGEARGGQSTYISLAFAMILILALSLPLVEFTRMLSDQRGVTSAASDMARFVAEDYDNHKDATAQRRFLDQAYPGLSAAAFTVTYGPQKTTNYEHHVLVSPSDPDSGWNTRPSAAISRDVQVAITLHRSWVTPVMTILSLSGMGDADGYTVEGAGSSSIDRTIADGW